MPNRSATFPRAAHFQSRAYYPGGADAVIGYGTIAFRKTPTRCFEAMASALGEPLALCVDCIPVSCERAIKWLAASIGGHVSTSNMLSFDGIAPRLRSSRARN